MKIQKTIVLKGTMSCNLACKYCYESRKNDDSSCSFCLSKAQVEVIIKRCARLLPNSRVLWLLHGGEPLLNGPAFVESVLKTVREVNESFSVSHAVAIQTNATLIDSQWCDLFAKYADVFGARTISISVDGSENLEGSVRVTHSGVGAHGLIEAGIKQLKAADLDFTTISVVGTHTVEHPEKVYSYIESLDPAFAKFIPCYWQPSVESSNDLRITPLKYAEFMCRIFDLWVKYLPFRADDRFVIDPIVSILAKLTGAPVTWCEFIPDKCTNFVSLYPNGDMWLCDDYDHKTMRSEAFLGNIFYINDSELEEIFCFPQNRCHYQKFYHKLVKNKCEACDIFQYCGGGCLSKRLYFQKISPKMHDIFCEGKKLLINHIRTAYDHACA